MGQSPAPVNRWVVCGVLLVASMLSYMDRQALTQTSERIIAEFRLGNDDWGWLDSAFGVGFALGTLVVGTLVDRVSVRVVYPLVVLAWSGVGFLTGFVHDYPELLACRFLLGLTEAGHVSCSVRTTQRLLDPAERSLGNAVLNAGGALGAVLTPLVVLLVFRWAGGWRPAFWVIGSFGLAWAAAWLIVVPRGNLGPIPGDRKGVFVDWARFARAALAERRVLVLLILVYTINVTWHFFRHWQLRFLVNGRGYNESDVQWFSSAYFIVADVGTLLGGATALWLARRGLPVHRGRIIAFAVGAALTPLSLAAATLPKGPVLLVSVLAVGFGAYWTFPLYYSFSQEITTRDQGKLTGSLGCCNWIALSLTQGLAGELIRWQGSYDLAIGLVGLPPLLGLAALLFLWRTNDRPAEDGAWR